MRKPRSVSGSDAANAPQGRAAVDPLEIQVPFQASDLVPPSKERVRALRRHLVTAMRDLREAKRPDRLIQPRTPAPDGFVADIVRSGCGLCRGFCCKGGGTHAYLDERTMARVRTERPEADARAVLRAYTEAVAPLGFEDSCVFHGPSGCTLPPPLRSELCNSYYCNGLRDFLKAPSAARPVRISAARGGATGGSIVLTGGAGDDRKTVA